MTARTIVIDPLMSPAEADEMVAICERFGTYGLYVVEKSETEFAPELTQRADAARNHVRTGGRFGRDEPTRVLALRTNYLPRELRLWRGNLHRRHRTVSESSSTARRGPRAVRPPGDRTRNRLRQHDAAGPGARSAHRRAGVPRREPQGRARSGYSW